MTKHCLPFTDFIKKRHPRPAGFTETLIVNSLQELSAVHWWTHEWTAVKHFLSLKALKILKITKISQLLPFQYQFVWFCLICYYCLIFSLNYNSFLYQVHIFCGKLENHSPYRVSFHSTSFSPKHASWNHLCMNENVKKKAVYLIKAIRSWKKRNRTTETLPFLIIMTTLAVWKLNKCVYLATDANLSGSEAKAASVQCLSPLSANLSTGCHSPNDLNSK